jgi:cob(I)alamin adenosyltransferase
MESQASRIFDRLDEPCETMKIYTKTGDRGTTGLFGGDRVQKVHPRIAAYGNIDELNATLGVVRAGYRGKETFDEIDDTLGRIQNELFVLGADLATPEDAKPAVPRTTTEMVTRLEQEIDVFTERMPGLTNFIVPGGSLTASALHVARTVCRRAERSVVDASVTEDLNPEVLRYINRLSDHLFVLARLANHVEGQNDVEWYASDRP